VLLYLAGRPDVKIVGQVAENWYANHKVVAICLNEIVSRYGCGIQMMLAKGSQEVLEEFKIYVLYHLSH